MSKPLYKTTIVIWSEFDPSNEEVDVMAREAIDGVAYCSKQDVEHVTNPDDDPDWDGTEFFISDDEEDDDEDDELEDDESGH